MIDDIESLSLKDQAYAASPDYLYTILGNNYDNMEELPDIISRAQEDCANRTIRRSVGEDYEHRKEKEKVLKEFLSGTGRFADIQAESDYLDRLKYLGIRDKASAAIVRSENKAGIATVKVASPARRKRKGVEEYLDPVLADIETALKAEIREAAVMTDPVEQLVKYQEIKERFEDKYDDKKVVLGNENKTVSRREDIILGGEVGGVMTSFVSAAVPSMIAGFAGLMLLSGVLFLLLTVALPAGYLIGKKLAINKYNKTYTPEQKHANRMFEMVRDVNKAIEKLTASLKEEDGLRTLRQHPRLEQDLPKLPVSIRKEFARQTALNQKRTAVLNPPAPAITTGGARPAAA